jgi:hypothetical protein
MIGKATFNLKPLVALFLVAGALPGAVDARTIYAITPSLTAGALHDDNLFLTPEPAEDDRITRYTPSIALDLTVDALTLNASYLQDAEYYEEHDELDSSALRRVGNATLAYQANERLSFGVEGSYTRAPTPGDLNIGTGLNLGRVRTTRNAAGAFVDYAFTQTLDSRLAYSVANDETENGIGGDTRELRMDFEKARNAANVLLFGYMYRQFDFEFGTPLPGTPLPGTPLPTSLQSDNEDSHTAMVGLEHRFSAVTSFRGMAGPRYYSGNVEPNIELKLEHEFATGFAEVIYTRSELLLAGSAERVETSILNVGFTKRIGNRFEFNLQPGFGRADSGFGTRVDVWQFGANAAYNFNDYVALTASWQHTRQDESFPGGGSRDIPRDVFMLAIKLSFPIRGERP